MRARVVAVAGRRVDAPGAGVARFPADRVEAVGRRIEERLGALARDGVQTLVAAAACGTDLLALEAAGRLGFRRRVVLPYEPGRFRSLSVVDRPGDWGVRFDRVVAEVAQHGDLVVLDAGDDETAALTDTNATILEEAIRLASAPGGRPRPDRVRALVVWDEVSRGADDVTAAFRAEAVARGCPVEDLRT